MEEDQYQKMVKKGQETDYHTSDEEQREIDRAGWDLQFPQDKFMPQINADIQSFREQLYGRTAREALSQDEIEQQVLMFSLQRYERGMRQLMAFYDLCKKKHFMKPGQSDSDRRMYVEAQYHLSLAIDDVKQALENKKTELGL